MTEQSETVSVVLDRDMALNIWCNLYNEADLTQSQWKAIKESLMHALAQPIKSTWSNNK